MRPIDAFLLQERLLEDVKGYSADVKRHLGSPGGVGGWGKLLSPGGEVDNAAAYRSLVRSLEGDPHLWGDNATMAAVIAARTIGTWTIDDTLSPCGSYWLNTPLRATPDGQPWLIDDDDEPSYLRGFSWARVTSVPNDRTEVIAPDGSTVRVPIRADYVGAEYHSVYLCAWGSRQEYGVPRGLAIRLIGIANQPTLTEVLDTSAIPNYHGEHIVTPWLDRDALDWDNIDHRTMALFASMVAFEQQVVVTSRTAKFDRTARKMAERAGRNAPTCRVVMLRREARTTNERSVDGNVGSRKRDFSWLVGGHWRNQFYPSRNANARIWISPYQKGDPALPLKASPGKVFHVAR